ncbi:gastric triacylglycerol lipase-like [Rhynchocyon petersi]
MWLLLTVTGLISGLGTAHGLFEKVIPTNAEVDMNVSQIISHWGYPNEEYDVSTRDHYILRVNRIPFGRNESASGGPRPVVFLQHGLLTSATDWISNLPNNSLAFILADSGYDVWLGNSRGNTWSRRHVYFSPDSAEFWAFSFDEMAKYDLPATIDFILRKTKQEKLHYVGHSQGTTIGLIAFSTDPKLAKRIKTFYALAPVATVTYTKSLLNTFVLVPRPLFKIIFGDKAFFPESDFTHFIAKEVCNREIIYRLCSTFFSLIGGFGQKNFNMSRLDVYLSHTPAGTSVQNVLHWIQLFHSGEFENFDWGNSIQNMLHYNQPTPPLYNVSAMKVPIALWSGGNDLLADPKDVDLLLPKLSTLIYHKRIPTYSHLDFIWAIDAQEIYNEMISMMARDKN